MKAGIAAMCAAAWRAHHEAPLAGEVRLAAVADEEATSLGTRALVDAGLRADAAIVTEPTALGVAVAHKGFAWITVTVHGTAAHGSRHDVGVDAIRHAGLVLAALHRADAALVTRTHPLLGRASLHAATIAGGEGLSTYPARCTFTVERRTLPGETGAHALAEVQSAIARAAEREPTLRATAVLDFEQAPLDTDPATPIVGALRAVVPDAPVTGVTYWADAALWHAAGVPTVLFGPGDIALAHGATEWVPLDEVDRATDALTRVTAAWCR
jgi:acetylornithine deacetylase